MLDCKSCYWYRPKQGRERYDRCRYFKGERQLILGTEAHAGCKHFDLRSNGAPIPIDISVHFRTMHEDED